jgi:hypothetical protein
MTKLLFLGVHGSADPTNAAMPFKEILAETLAAKIPIHV